ncbi:hypothetical protein DLJ53_19610 [Acuticoccus sediminis]|uniref:Uncharacterized protein n=2 Tax=Acuticoccus sediminis TaxID=2184697 RepID=A0A8B2NNV5_9HYPH|nr:hypothetical protein DLJ53_19610 [Acuticoccus sediminis]
MAVGALAGTASAAAAQTVDVIVMQSDADPNSLRRGIQVQRGMLNVWNGALNGPAIGSYLKQYGLDGLDVYDETAVIVDSGLGYDPNRERRQDAELLSLAFSFPGQSIDAVVLYTVYAKAVPHPYTKISLLRASMQYRVLNRDGRVLAGDNVQLDTEGIPLTGCATQIADIAPDDQCVRDAVTENLGRMASDAANRIAIQIASIIGQQYGSLHTSGGGAGGAPGANVAIDGGTTHGAVLSGPSSGGYGCDNLPVTYLLTFTGIDARQKNAIEEFMSSWSCYSNLELEDESLTRVTYRYKTKADRARIMRNIRLMFEAMGVFVDPRTLGEREIVVDAVTLRND